MQKAPTILGISPGTRSMGIAIWRGNRLTEWQIKAFKGAWSEGKLRDILYCFQVMLERHEITALALKQPVPVHSSPALERLILELKNVARQKKLRLKLYTLPDLKAFCSHDRKFTKTQMIRFVAAKHEVFHLAYYKEQKNRNPYYGKMFEAIIAALLYQKEYLKRHSVPSPYPQDFL